ncbi:MAG: bifunctional 4-hydroxy-2-oxoglutarate aldolase/2-dehydro-3-deoxy-phosphogluconate aldolase [Bacteroidia bacterium]|nr:bifunctional 4-hydroxy-2-oxoglutarate aldolase/2-dehydro-3-deoxy-phosphogluconate aldolase [Bacteroidia bacterium]
MAKYSRLEVALAMKESGLVPLYYHKDFEVVKAVVQACYDGGARLFEFTNRGDFAHEVFAPLSKFCHESLPGMMLGVGSIVDAPTAAMYMQMGADFIVSASLKREIALTCNRRKVLYAPGCGSLTEIGDAEELGCEIIKLFPGSHFGPGFVKAVKAPQPWTSIMPTGGVAPNTENLQGWFKAGVSCVGMGSKLIVKDGAGNLDLAEIQRLTTFALDQIKEIRASL